MSLVEEKSLANVLRNELAALIVTPGFRQIPVPPPVQEKIITQAWAAYQTLNPTISKRSFRAKVKKTVFIDRYSVDTFLLTVLKVTF